MQKHFVLGGLILMGLVVAIVGLSPDFALAAAALIVAPLIVLFPSQRP